MSDIFDTFRAERYFSKRLIVEIYKGYEIRKYENMYIVDAAIAIHSTMSNNIEDCRKFIDDLVDKEITQYDNEAAARYIFNIKIK